MIRRVAKEKQRRPSYTLLSGYRLRYVRHARLMARAVFVILPLLSAVSTGYTEPLSTSSSVITSIGTAHDLPGAGSGGERVHLVGTVTFYDPADEELFIQDATGGIYVETDRPYAFQIGDLLEVIGKTDPSYRTSVANGASMRVLGRGQSYASPLYQYSGLIAGDADSRLVQVRGRLRAANIEQHANSPSAHLDLVMPGGRAAIYLASSTGFNPGPILDAEVEVTGVAGAQYNEKNQVTGVVLYARDFNSIRILQRPKLPVDQLPITDVDRVFESRSVTDNSSRVRVHGTVTYYQKGASVVLETSGKSIFIETRQTNELKVGEIVDAYGFGSSNEYAPMLRDAFVIQAGGFEPISPRPVTYDQALSGFYSDNLIQLTGRMISQMRRDRSDVLVIDVDGHLITGYVQTTTNLAGLPLGSLISVAGICRIDAGGPWRAPYGFHLDLRDPQDLHLLAYPSWWTVDHLVELLSLIALIAIGTATWASVLRRRNTKQTLRIQASMIVAEERSRILEQISSNTQPAAVLSEICESVQRLFPELACHYTFDQQHSAPPKRHANETERQIRVSLTNTSGDEVGEVVVITRKKGELSAEQLELVTSLIELSTLAVRQALLYEGLVHHSTHDPLTNLANRRLCDHRLALALEQAAREQRRLAVIYVDVNRFKEVNDRFGHKIGDCYLKLISQRFLEQTRPYDTVARIGGDEFLLIVPLTAEAEDTEALVARLWSCFELPFVIEDAEIEGSASFGVAVYPDDGATADDLKRNADYAMYLAKRSETEGHQRIESLDVISLS